MQNNIYNRTIQKQITTARTMKAAVYKENGVITLEDRPVPVLTDPRDAIVKVTLTTIWNLVFKTGGVDASCCEEIMKLIKAGKLDTGCLITHRTKLEHIMEAYDVFENKRVRHIRKTCKKVIKERRNDYGQKRLYHN